MRFPLRRVFVGMTLAGVVMATVVADYRALQAMRSASLAVQKEFHRGTHSADLPVGQALVRAALARPGQIRSDREGRPVEAFHWCGGLLCHEVRVVYRSPAEAKSLHTEHRVSWWGWAAALIALGYLVTRVGCPGRLPEQRRRGASGRNQPAPA